MNEETKITTAQEPITPIARKEVLVAQIGVKLVKLTYEDGTSKDHWATAVICRRGGDYDQRVVCSLDGTTDLTETLMHTTAGLVKANKEGQINITTENCLDRGTTIEQDNERQKITKDEKVAEFPALRVEENKDKKYWKKTY